MLYSANLNAEEYAAHAGNAERVGSIELMIGKEFLPELLSKPGFVIEGITEEGAYVRVRFTYDPGANEARNTVVSGSFALDPEYYWLVVDATLEHVTAVSRRPSFTQVLRIEYGKEMVGGLRSPIVTTSERKSAVVAAQNFTNRTATYLYETDSYRRESDYTLASFGVAEPEWARRSTPWYWYALIAGIFAVVAVLLWWRWQSAVSRSRS